MSTNYHKTVGILLLLTITLGCSTSGLPGKQKRIVDLLGTQGYEKQHTGLLVFDLEKERTLISRNANKYFVPASTVKLFTCYAALQLLPDSLPALKYSINGTTLTAIGTGDPTWLHPYFKNEAPLDFLKQFDAIQLYLDNYEGGPFGPGWAWEDYPYYFSPEISPLPLYGNVATILDKDDMPVQPDLFNNHIEWKKGEQGDHPRAWKENKFYVSKGRNATIQIPYITSPELTQELLEQRIDRSVQLLKEAPKNNKWTLLSGMPRDSVLKRMLWKSDNFIAEQLVLACSSMLSDTLSFSKARERILTTALSPLEQEPRWVDGSGLSRYNLFTPRSMVHLLRKLHSETETVRLFTLLPQWPPSEPAATNNNHNTPAFIYAKSGSMGNIYNLCGYLRTDSGRLLAFSFMNNHFRRPSSEVREDMYAILKRIARSY